MEGGQRRWLVGGTAVSRLGECSVGQGMSPSLGRLVLSVRGNGFTMAL